MASFLHCESESRTNTKQHYSENVKN